MKLLFVLEHYHPYIGGAEKLFRNICEGLHKKGYSVTVITTRFNADLPKEELLGGVRVIRLPLPNRYLYTLFAWWYIIPYARQSDVIHTTTYNAALPAWVAARFTGKPLSITIHEVWADLWFRLPFINIIQKLSYYLFEQFVLFLPYDRVVAVSQATAIRMTHCFPSRHAGSVIYNGLDTSKLQQYTHQPPVTFTYCYFGRLGTSKGLDILLHAVAEFSKANPDAICKLIIPMVPKAIYSKVLQLIEKLNIQSRIQLLSHLSEEDLYHEVSHSSCVVIPSHSEGFCFTAVEACAMGVPVISSGRGALPEVIGGKHITLEKLDTASLVNALGLACRNEWDVSNPKQFPLETMIDAYSTMFKGL